MDKLSLDVAQSIFESDAFYPVVILLLVLLIVVFIVLIFKDKFKHKNKDVSESTSNVATSGVPDVPMKAAEPVVPVAQASVETPADLPFVNVPINKMDDTPINIDKPAAVVETNIPTEVVNITTPTTPVVEANVAPTEVVNVSVPSAPVVETNVAPSEHVNLDLGTGIIPQEVGTPAANPDANVTPIISTPVTPVINPTPVVPITPVQTVSTPVTPVVNSELNFNNVVTPTPVATPNVAFGSMPSANTTINTNPVVQQTPSYSTEKTEVFNVNDFNAEASKQEEATKNQVMSEANNLISSIMNGNNTSNQ